MRLRRSCLSVPATEPRFHAAAARSGADEVLLDLEDSVVPAAKAEARGGAVAALREHDYSGKVRSVRVNSAGTPWFEEDVRTVVGESGDRLDALVVPKVDSAEEVRRLDGILTELERGLGRTRPVGLELQIETARGLENVSAIAAASARTEALIFGPGDFAASMGMPHLTIGGTEGLPPEFWLYPLFRLAVAARAGGLQVIDGPYVRIRDLDGLRVSALRTAQLGYDGKWALHPDQVPVLNQVYTPALEDFERAAAILDAYPGPAGQGDGPGAVMLGDEMIDEATRKMAEALYQRGIAAGLRAERG